MKKIISLISLNAMLAVPVFAQTSANIRVNSLNALVQLPILSTNLSAMVSGNATIGDGGFAGDFTYDSTSSAATNTYSVFKPAATTGRWIRRNEAAWNQFASTTPADSSTYAFSLRRNLQTNVFNLGADNNNVYLQSQASYGLHLNNLGNNTILNATAGYVGIGTVTPLTQAVLWGMNGQTTAALTDAGSVTAILTLTDGSENAGGGGTLAFSGDSTGLRFAAIKGLLTNGGVNSTGDLAVSTRNAASDVALTERLRVVGTTGFLGLGTASPVSLEEIQGGLTTGGAILTLGTKEPSVVVNDVLGRINFYAPLDAAGTDANLVAGSISSVAEGTFSATSNASSLIFQTGASEIATTKLTISSAGNVTVANGNVLLGTAGNGLQIKEGSNARMGTSTLSGGTTGAISNTSAVTGDRIFITRVSGTTAEFGHLAYSINTGVSLTITSTDAQDDSVVNWLIIKPTP